MALTVDSTITDDKPTTRPLNGSTYEATLVATAYEQSVLTLEDWGKRVAELVDSQAETDRRMAVAKRRRMLEDNWDRDLVDRMNAWLSTATARAVMGPKRDQVDISDNPFRDIVDELAVMYSERPSRTSEPPEAAKTYAELLEGTGFDDFWQDVDRALEAYNDVVIYPRIVSTRALGIESRKIEHCWAAGDSLCVIFDEDHIATPWAVVVINSWFDVSGTLQSTYDFWSDDWHARFNAAGDLVGPHAMDGSFDVANPYGFIPFHWLHLRKRSDRFWDTTSGRDLYETGIKIGRRGTYGDYLYKMSSHKQIIASGNVEAIQGKQLLNPGAIIRIPGDGVTAQIIDWQIDHEARERTSDAIKQRAAASRGLNPEKLKRGGNYQTAQGAKLAERGLMDRRRKKTPHFQEAEQAYYTIVATIANRAGMAKLPVDAKLTVNHGPISYPDDPVAELDKTERGASLGVESLADYMIRRDPSLTRDDAKRKIRENVEFNAEIALIKTRHNVPDSLTNESRAAEQDGKQGPAVRDNPPDSPTGHNQAEG